MTNLFGSLDIGIRDFLDIWCLSFEISEDPHTRDILSKNYPSIEYSAIKFHTRRTCQPPRPTRGTAR